MQGIGTNVGAIVFFIKFRIEQDSTNHHSFRIKKGWP
jgi:hypothetical protein